ncbi:MAG: aspartate carbamoyltransferase [Propionibacteriaceae bacterium]|jgi:aspartate carbamoyltransferase catalytic subunit|nr:aspartate carbamoyltransferase [Propionibacteriaceae bacterium]
MTHVLPLFEQGRHLLSVSQFDRSNLGTIFEVADAVDLIAKRQGVCTVLDGAMLGSLFFEPSTRTRLSFESAFLRLGGEVTTTTGFTFSSMAKGESIADTARVVSGYSDVLVVRHPEAGSVAEFARHSTVPVVNAGDGAGEHPSQALLDVYTLQKELHQRGKTVDRCHIAILGDLKFGRTVHSLIKLMSLYESITFTVFAPTGLELPLDVEQYAQQRGHRLQVAPNVVEAVRGADAIYATRVQRERMTAELAQSAARGDLLNRAILTQASNEDAIIMHPLPRDSRPDSYDLSSDVDELSGLAIFHQTDNGLNIRMAIFLTALGVTVEAVRLTTKQRPWKATLRS